MHLLNSAHILAAILGGLVFAGMCVLARAVWIAWIMHTDSRALIDDCTEYEHSTYGDNND